jgi:uncharacterized membrane protein YgcG
MGLTDMATRSWHRLWRHVVTDQRSVRRVLSAATLQQIETATAAGETRHRGQVRLAVEASLPPGRVFAGLAPRERALEVFGLLRVWDTEENVGVLVYVLLADRDVEIVADRGIDRRVGPEAWEAICRTMEAAFRRGDFAQGALQGIDEINALLARHFPRVGEAVGNELPDRPLVL